MRVVTQFHLLTALLVVVAWLGIVTYMRLRRHSSIVYVLFVTIFYVYIVKVIDYALFQFQSLLILKHFMPGLLLNGQSAEQSLNLVPLVTLSPADLRTSLLNILLLVPFGFGLPFLTGWRMKKVVCVGALFSIAIAIYGWGSLRVLGAGRPGNRGRGGRFSRRVYDPLHCARGAVDDHEQDSGGLIWH